MVVGALPSDLAGWDVAGDVPFPLDADRWAEERQYLRHDAGLALDAFRRRRREVLAFLGRLTPEQWRRGSIHPTFGRVTFAEWTAGMAAHDTTTWARSSARWTAVPDVTPGAPRAAARAFRDLHAARTVLVLPNAWRTAALASFEQPGFRRSGRRARGTCESFHAHPLSRADGQRLFGSS